MLGILKKAKKNEATVIRKYSVGQRVPPNKKIDQVIRDALHRNDVETQKLRHTI